jgi:spore photoproduct lyase
MLGIRKVFVTRDVEHHPLTLRFKEKLLNQAGSHDGRNPDWSVIEKTAEAYAHVNESYDPIKTGKRTLLLTRNRGQFIKPCPGTREYQCCSYQILHWASYCPMDCVYCILQAYFHPPLLQIFVNQDDLWRELDNLFRAKRLKRIGTGEFTDSLIWEPLSDLTPRLVESFGRQSQSVLELKTKTVDIGILEKLDHNRKTILAWSLNSEAMIRQVEFGTTPLKKRLQAARQCAQWGYPLAFHFDPLIIYEGWQQDYAAVIDALFRVIDPNQIVWISLGSFRFMPGLKEIIQNRFPKLDVIYGEFIPGLDGKMRYFKPLRIELYKKIIQWISLRAPRVPLYFCMEDDLVWRACLGFTPDEKGGLGHILDNSAKLHCRLRP